MSETFDARWFASRLGQVTRRGIAQETAALVRTGALPVGAKLPTVRDLAFELRVSPATISQAWADLRRYKIISGRGRNGSWVTSDSFSPRPLRLMSGQTRRPHDLNLSRAVPDPALLPDLRQALIHGAHAQGLNSYERVRILPELEAAARTTWPYDASGFLATSGGYSAVHTIVHALVPPGAPVAVEDPTGLRILDILEDFNAPILPVACDEAGPQPDALAEALARRPALFIFQPRVHAVTGALLTPERLADLGRVLQGSDTLVLEDDGIADISDAPRQSLGHAMPDRVIHVLSYSKTLGPDLRLAVLSSSAVIVEEIQTYREFSAGWTSRILQAAGAWLLGDPGVADTVARARKIYRERRECLAGEFRQRGVPVQPGHGLSLFVPVSPGRDAAALLGEQGIGVAPGKNFSLCSPDFVRVAASCLPTAKAAAAADAIACAAGWTVAAM